MRRVQRRSVPGTLLLLGLLLLPALLPITAAHARAQAQRFQALTSTRHGERASSVQEAQSDPTGIDAPIADPTGSPALDLSWQTLETHAGVPAILTVRAVDAEGARDGGRSGSVMLFFDDLYAEVYSASAGREVDASQLAAETIGERLIVDVPLQGGAAVLAVLFKTAGSQGVLAHLTDAPEIAGQSPGLVVHDVFFSIDPPTARAKQAAQANYTITVRDGEGELMPEYAGTVAITTSDGNARVGESTSVEHSFRPSDQGQTTVAVAFSQDGAQTITVGDGTPWRTATLDLSVETDEAIARPPSGPELEGTAARRARHDLPVHLHGR